VSGRSERTVTAALPLDGVRVLDLTVAWSGPYVTMLLADFGAEVIRVENPWVFPTSTRGVFPRPPKEVVAGATNLNMSGYPDLDPGERPWNRSAIFTWHSRNKRSMTLDLRKESGREIFLRLVDVSQVLVENNAPATLGRLGIDPELLLARNERFAPRVRAAHP
jgi:crotonobetainyl-CoA:carnitine CoA-transferase CaiB-like acyl-CoA transferase